MVQLAIRPVVGAAMYDEAFSCVSAVSTDAVHGALPLTCLVAVYSASWLDLSAPLTMSAIVRISM